MGVVVIDVFRVGQLTLAIAVEYWNWLSSKLHPGLYFNRTKHSQIGTGYLANSTNSCPAHFP
jgi:hypothetical protein